MDVHCENAYVGSTVGRAIRILRFFLMALREDVKGEVFEGDPIPAHTLEVLKDLYRKAAIRKLRRVQMAEKQEAA